MPPFFMPVRIRINAFAIRLELLSFVIPTQRESDNYRFFQIDRIAAFTAVSSFSKTINIDNYRFFRL